MLTQARVARAQLEDHDRMIGWKIGATSRAVMDQLGINEPILGCMTSRSEYSALREVNASRFCKPAVEGEIAFVMERPLKGPASPRRISSGPREG